MESAKNMKSETFMMCVIALFPMLGTAAVAASSGVQLWENGPYWAECNVGAENPEDAGLYFSWGDTLGTENGLTAGKSDMQLRTDGFIDASGVLTKSHDAARARLGGQWRMPTAAEVAALSSHCTTKWTTQNGVPGRLVTGKDGYAEKSIFLPAAGYRVGNELRAEGAEGHYWSSSPNSGHSDYAWRLGFDVESFKESSGSIRRYGRPVRAVRGFAEDLRIFPRSGTTFEKSLPVSISCAAKGAEIHFTTNGVEPTKGSPKYARFRVHGKTTVKARAYFADGTASDVVAAEYARGCCSEPEIRSEAGATFQGAAKVEIIRSSPEGTLHYTLDGAEPTAASPIYSEPFSVETTTVVKAKVMSDAFFDSKTVSMTLTKVRGVGDSLGLPGHRFESGGAADWIDDQGQAMKSGAISNGQMSILKTNFEGKGRLAFELKLSCEKDEPEYQAYDHFELWIDGECKELLDGVQEWRSCDYNLKDGRHNIEWRYVKDGMDDQSTPNPDGVWLRNVVWVTDGK